jgi:hypothetical protein
MDKELSVLIVLIVLFVFMVLWSFGFFRCRHGNSTKLSIKVSDVIRLHWCADCGTFFGKYER